MQLLNLSSELTKIFEAMTSWPSNLTEGLTLFYGWLAPILVLSFIFVQLRMVYLSVYRARDKNRMQVDRIYVDIIQKNFFADHIQKAGEEFVEPSSFVFYCRPTTFKHCVEYGETLKVSVTKEQYYRHQDIDTIEVEIYYGGLSNKVYEVNYYEPDGLHLVTD